jgi:hypothetical protein
MPALRSFDYAIIRVVPRVEREEFVNVGVILFCRTCPFLGARMALDRNRLLALAPDIDLTEVEGQLALISLVCAGDPAAAPMSELSLSARFHWLVSPRSTVIQMSPVHPGLSRDPEATLAHLVDTVVRTPSFGPSDAAALETD